MTSTALRSAAHEALRARRWVTRPGTSPQDDTTEVFRTVVGSETMGEAMRRAYRSPSAAIARSLEIAAFYRRLRLHGGRYDGPVCRHQPHSRRDRRVKHAQAIAWARRARIEGVVI